MTKPDNGFAAAVQPIEAHTIHTDANGLREGMVEVPATDRAIPAYRAQPDGEGPYPVVLVIMEIFGLHEYIRDVCRRFAKRGYLAIAPDIFVRAGDPSTMTDFMRIRDEIVYPTPDPQIMSDLDATVRWAKSSSHGDTAPVGIIGFCWGGRIVWLYAAHSSEVKAGVAWYGRLDGDRDENQTTWPVDVAGSLHAPVLGLYGGQDASIPQDLVARFNEALAAADSESFVHVYPEGTHGFHADYRPNYRKAEAEDGEQRMYTWLADHGVA